MALSTIKNGYSTTAPDTSENTIELHDDVKKPSPIPVWYIQVTSGTIQFAADEAIAVGHYAWPVDSKIPMSVHKTLHYKAASNTDKFVITV
jgi:uncharacterized protein YfaT (DUF1175 family)